MKSINRMRILFAACNEESCKYEKYAIVFERTYVIDLIVIAVKKLGHEIRYDINGYNECLAFHSKQGIDLTNCINKHFPTSITDDKCLLSVICANCGKYLGVVCCAGHYYPDSYSYEYIFATDIENMIIDAAHAVVDKINKINKQIEWVAEAKETIMPIEDQILGKVK